MNDETNENEQVVVYLRKGETLPTNCKTTNRSIDNPATILKIVNKLNEKRGKHEKRLFDLIDPSVCPYGVQVHEMKTDLMTKSQLKKLCKNLKNKLKIENDNEPFNLEHEDGYSVFLGSFRACS